MKIQRCEGPCGRTLPLNEDHFLVVRRFYRSRGMVDMGRFVRKCHRCRTSAMMAATKERLRKLSESVAARTKIVCGTCGKEKDASDKNFSRRPNGTFLTTCKTCKRLWAAEYRKTKRYSRFISRSRRKRRTAHRRTNRTSAQREARARYSAKMSPADVKARNILTGAIRSGLVVRPEKCQRDGCRRRGHLRAHFHKGRERPLDVIFLCYTCFWAATCGRKVVEAREADRVEEALMAIPEDRRAFARRVGREMDNNAGATKIDERALLDNLRPRPELGEDLAEIRLAALVSASRPERPWTDERLTAAGSRVTLADLEASPLVRRDAFFVALVLSGSAL